MLLEPERQLQGGGEVALLQRQLGAGPDQVREAVAAVVDRLPLLERRARAGDVAAQEPDGSEERGPVGLPRARAPPLREALVRGLQPLLRLAQLAAEQQRAPAPQVDAEHAEQRAAAVSERAQLLPTRDRLLAVGQRQHHQRGDGEQGRVDLDQHVVGKRPLRQRRAAVGVRPGHRQAERDHRREHLGAGSLALDDLRVEVLHARAAHSVARGRELRGAQRLPRVDQLRRRLRGGLPRHRGRLVSGRREEERPRERARRVRAQLRILEALPRVAQVGGGGRPGRQHLGQPQLEQQAGPALGRRRLLDRAGEQRHRGVRRALGARGGGSGGEHVDDPRIAAARRGQQVRRDLLRRRLVLGEQRGRASVAHDALRERHLVVDRVAHERVHEPGGRLRHEDLGAGERRRGDGRLLERHAGQRGGHALHGDPEDGERLRQGDRLVPEPVQPHQHGARDRPRPDPAHGARLARERPDVLLGERREELAQQQRVAARGLEAGRGERRLRLPAEAVRDQPGHGRLAQGPRHDAERVRVRRELGDEHGIDAGLAAAQAQREHDPRPRQPAGDEREVAERRRVAPVEVVDDEQQPAVFGEVRGQPVEPVERGERAVARSRARRRQRLEDGRGRGGGAGQEPFALAGQHGLEQLAHDPEREVALEMRAAARQRPHAQSAGAAVQLVEQPALADPRGSLDDHGPGQAPLPAQDLLERGQLALSLQQRRLANRRTVNGHLHGP